jgi:serine/threonine-protein kinase HipA
MFGDGSWQLAPAYDLCFSYKPGNPFIESHQMSCNGKRDGFLLEDLLAAAISADVKNPKKIIEEVQLAVSRWSEFARKVGIDDDRITHISKLHRTFL